MGGIGANLGQSFKAILRHIQVKDDEVRRLGSDQLQSLIAGLGFGYLTSDPQQHGRDAVTDDSGVVDH